MALAVENSAALLNAKTRSYGRWNYAELDTDYPELVDGVRQLLEIDEATFSVRNERVQADRMYTSPYKMADGVPKSLNRNEGSLFNSPTRLSKGETTYLRQRPQLSSPKHSSESLFKVGRALDHSVKQRHNETELSITGEHLQRSKYQFPYVGDAIDNMDIGGIQRIFPSYSSTPKPLLSKTMHGSEVVSPRYSKRPLSVTLPEVCSLRQPRIRSRSLSAARRSSDVFIPRLNLSQADMVEDCLVGAQKSMQYSIGDAVETGNSWKESPFQVDYWACAIPSTLPPSPDRRSPHWNPDKEYQDLLDYTYPLNSKQLRSREKAQDYVSPEPCFHDSGIGLDSISFSPDHTVQSVSTSCDDTQHSTGSKSRHADKYARSSQQFYTKLFNSAGFPESETDNSPPTSVDKEAFEKCSYSTERAALSTDFKTPFFQCTLSNSSSSENGSEWISKEGYPPRSELQRDVGFIPSTHILQFKCHLDSDDEFLSLPPRLHELENLAQKLKGLSLPVQKCDYDNKGRHHPTGIDSCAPPLFTYAEGIDEKYFDSISGDGSEDTVEQGFLFHEPHMTKDSQGQVDTTSGLKQLISMSYMFAGISASDNTDIDGQHQYKESTGGNVSLLQRIKMFCNKLEELIQWLYKVAEVSENWVPPKPDVESIQSALQLYLKFKKDVVCHQTVAENVVKMGDVLLKCMASNSPVLKDALALIMKQSEELERRGERLYASVLGAMDKITDDDSKRNSDNQQAGFQEMESYLMRSLEEK